MLRFHTHFFVQNEEESRMLGTYYRVGFYGKVKFFFIGFSLHKPCVPAGTKFGSRNGHEYVYKVILPNPPLPSLVLSKGRMLCVCVCVCVCVRVCVCVPLVDAENH